MTPEEAYEKLQIGKMPMQVMDCLDFGDFYAFALAPINVKKDSKYCIGTVLDAVDKKTGNVFSYDITDDPDAFRAAKRLSVKSIVDIPLKYFGGSTPKGKNTK